MLNLECFKIQRIYNFTVMLKIKLLMTKGTMLVTKLNVLVAMAVIKVKLKDV